MHSLNVLVISENSYSDDKISSLLSHALPNCTYREVDSQSALDFINQKQWDFIIAPLKANGITGLQVIDALASQVMTCLTRILLTHSNDAHVEAAVRDYAWFKGIGIRLTPGPPQILDVIELSNLKHPPTAKHRNSFIFPTLNEELVKSCLEQIAPYFQPQHRVSDKALYGAEVLARWLHPVHGVLSPSHFLESFNSSEARSNLWKRMLEQTLAALRALNTSSLTFALNVTPDVANTLAWAENLVQSVVNANLKPNQLSIEVTEQICELEEPALAGVIGHLRLTGFNCAIDDFGTGTSSLQRLARTPFSTLKIDKCCIRSARTSFLAQKILLYTINLAHDLGLSVVAEGIETEEDFDRIANLGCDIGQGYYFAPPMPFDQFFTYAS
ncbi:EAL domain-containing protein [Pseudomonas sp. KCJK9016]|uniref:EAL domain-containing protein n=1 Tax=Pseudomonas sp. KCJK9016 TaxID=3344556 RepID=UPI003905ADA6